MASSEDPTQLGERAMRDLRQPLAQWLAENVRIDEEVGADTIVEVLTVSVGGLISLRPSPDVTVTRFSPEEVESLVQRIIPMQVADAQAPDQAEMERDFQAVWFQFLAFLGDTGRWTGSQGDLETCLSLLQTEEPDLEAALALAAADVDADEEDATILTSLPVRAAAAVLAHVGEGLDVPDDEEIAADDVTAILAGFEHHVPITADDGEPQHLEDVPWLHLVVLAMIELELLETDEAETLLTPTEAAADWLQPTPGPRELRRELVGRFLLTDPETLGGGFSVAEAVMPSLFAAAMTGHPLDDEALDEVMDTLADMGPAASVVAAEEVRHRLADLAVFGVVSENAPWTVARGYWPAVAAGVAGDDDGLEDVFGDGGEEPLWLESLVDQLGLGDDQKRQIRDILGGR